VTEERAGIVAGAPSRRHGRAFIPIVRRTVHIFERSAAISLDPIGIYVVDENAEYYYSLRGAPPDFSHVERLDEILQQERMRPA